jgi:hypothetical protein
MWAMEKVLVEVVSPAWSEGLIVHNQAGGAHFPSICTRKSEGFFCGIKKRNNTTSKAYDREEERPQSGSWIL